MLTRLRTPLLHFLLVDHPTLRILTPPRELPDPPNDTPGALKQVATGHLMTSQGFLGHFNLRIR